MLNGLSPNIWANRVRQVKNEGKTEQNEPHVDFQFRNPKDLKWLLNLFFLGQANKTLGDFFLPKKEANAFPSSGESAATAAVSPPESRDLIISCLAEKLKFPKAITSCVESHFLKEWGVLDPLRRRS